MGVPELPVESDLPKGYRGAAERSSNVGVPAFPYRGAAERSSNVGVPAFEVGGNTLTSKVGVPECGSSRYA